MKTFKLIIATLDKILVEEDVLAIYFPTPNGEIGVLTNHATYLTNTLSGEARYIKGNKEKVRLNLVKPGLFFIQDNHARLWICL